MKTSNFFMLVCVVLFVPLVFSDFTYEKFETIKLGLLSIFLGLALFFTVNKKFNYHPHLLKALAVFMTSALLATIFSGNKAISIMGQDFIWTGLYFYLLWSLLLLMLISELNRPRLNLLLGVIVFVGLANSIWSILQTYGFGHNFLYNPYQIGYLVRANGLIGNPNFVSMFLACVAPIAIYFWMVSKNPKTKIYYGVSAFFIIWATMLLASRGGTLALAGSLFFCVVFLAYYRRSYWQFAVALVLSISLFLVFSPLVRNYELTNTENISEANIVQRLNSWTNAWDVSQQRLITGVGFGNNAEVHNLFLNLLVSGGVIFVSSFLFLCGYPLWKIYKKHRTQNFESEDLLFDISLVSSFLAFLISAMFNPVAISVWVLFAVILAAMVTQSETLTETKRVVSRYVVIFTVLLVVLPGLFLASQYFLFQGLRAQVWDKNYEKSSSLFKISSMFNPMDGISQINLAYSKIRLGKPDSEIEADISKVQTLNPHDKMTYFRSALLYHELYKKTHTSEYLRLAISNFEQAGRLEPEFYQSFFYPAYYLYLNKDYDQSFKYLVDGLLIKPDYYQAWALLANIYSERGNIGGAKFATEEAYKITLRNYDINQSRYFLKHQLRLLNAGQLPGAVPVELPTENLLH